MAGPDITGFFDAQARLREATGVDAVFRKKIPEEWPDGTQLNRETGRPFDPTVKPVSGGGHEEVVIRCSIVTQLASHISGATAERAAGAFRDADIALGLPAARKGEIDGVAEVDVKGVVYRITDVTPDPAFNQVARYMVFGEAK